MNTNKIFINIFVLIFASKATRGQSHSPSLQSPHWGSWSSWSSCTAKMEVGIRIRNRMCIDGSCHHLPGENYELQLCSSTAKEERSQKESFFNKCKFDPLMNNTLSCKLYLENPSMAYNIFKTTNCLFTEDQDNDDADAVRSFHQFLLTEISASRLQTASNVQEPKPGLLSRLIRNKEAAANRSLGNAVLLRREKKKLISRFCKHTCSGLVLQALRDSSEIATASSTASVSIHHSRRITLRGDDSSAVSLEYVSCVKSCRSSGTAYQLLAKKLLHQGIDQTPKDPKLCLNLVNAIKSIKESEVPKNVNRKRRSTSSSAAPELVLRPLVLTLKESELYVRRAEYSRMPGVSRKIVKNDRRRFDKIVSSNTTPEELQHIIANFQVRSGNRRSSITAIRQTTLTKKEENVTLSRSKRQVINASRYHSPCYEIADYPDNPRVTTLDNRAGELFFFEGRQQRFLRRRCAGSAVVPRMLFRPSESVTQTRTGLSALCKQGYLRRYGLIIQLDPAGLFAFNNGDRFSVKFKPFMLESHCALSTFE